MEVIRRKRTIGALNRRFERDRVFQFADTIAGPAVTPMDTDNSGLALRYGTYPAVPKPKWWSIGRWELVWGKASAQWARLSDMDGNWCIFGELFAVRW